MQAKTVLAAILLQVSTQKNGNTNGLEMKTSQQRITIIKFLRLRKPLASTLLSYA